MTKDTAELIFIQMKVIFCEHRAHGIVLSKIRREKKLPRKQANVGILVKKKDLRRKKSKLLYTFKTKYEKLICVFYAKRN